MRFLLVLTAAVVLASCAADSGARSPTRAASEPTTVDTSVPQMTARSRPAALPAACPRATDEPSFATGTYCGPTPPAGQGYGPDGICTGAERVPPCGPGAVPGKYYAYTMPGSCDGRIWFDGSRWVSELPSPTPVASFHVFVAIQGDGRNSGFISPKGAVGFRPDNGLAPAACRS
jgi:hypothetical protein